MTNEPSSHDAPEAQSVFEGEVRHEGREALVQRPRTLVAHNRAAAVDEALVLPRPVELQPRLRNIQRLQTARRGTCGHDEEDEDGLAQPPPLRVAHRASRPHPLRPNSQATLGTAPACRSTAARRHERVGAERVETSGRLAITYAEASVAPAAIPASTARERTSTRQE